MQIIPLLKRIKDLGFSGVKNRIGNRTAKRIFAIRWKKKALARKANHTWLQICKKEFFFPDFQSFFNHTSKLPFPPTIPPTTSWNGKKPSWKSTSNNKVMTPTDFEYQNVFYRSIHPSAPSQTVMPLQPAMGETATEMYVPDIKVPWELSRFQNVFVGEEDFCATVLDWIEENPFLLGVNWVCPMEVAIRSINWIRHFWAFKHSPKIRIDFWENFFCSLYDHLVYLEHNWETSDRPNNHYIADLVGHFYLSHFFDSNHRINKTFIKILEQFDHQILPDGTSYEGSTAYHRLDTELFLLFSLICKTRNIELDDSFHKKLTRMTEFLTDCSTENNFVQIGDNDSGKIISGVSAPKSYQKGIKHYSNFGLTIIRTENWHVTFRHATYKPHQPTGHFHNDQLSVTVTYKDIPILVDPGSYVYTANSAWRNVMRSYKAHSTFYELLNKTDCIGNSELFQLPRLPHNDNAIMAEDDNFVSVEGFYENRKRTVVFDKTSNEILIKDHPPTEVFVEWNFIFHPMVQVKQVDEYLWEIFFDSNKILFFLSSIILKKEEGFYAPKYGSILECICLSGTEKSQDSPTITRLSQTIPTNLYTTQTKQGNGVFE